MLDRNFYPRFALTEDEEEINVDLSDEPSEDEETEEDAEDEKDEDKDEEDDWNEDEKIE